jgi:hypothetical protein
MCIARNRDAPTLSREHGHTKNEHNRSTKTTLQAVATGDPSSEFVEGALSVAPILRTALMNKSV